MKISRLLLLIILIPIFIGIVVACYFQFNRYKVMSNFIQANINEKHANYIDHLEERSLQAKKIAEIFANNNRVAEALEKKDYQHLISEGSDFAKLDEGEVYFTDVDRNILATSTGAATSEGVLPFQDSCFDKQLLVIKNELKIAYCKKIYNTEKNLLGYVVSMGPLNKSFFEEISKEYLIETEFSHKGIHYSSLNTPNNTHQYERFLLPYKIGNETIHFTLLTDNSAARNSLYHTFITMVGITLLVGLALFITIPLVIKKYITNPLMLLERKIVLFYLNEIVDDREKIPENEIQDIYNALHMLHRTVGEKEKQLKEKTENLEKDNLLLKVISHDVANTLTIIQGSLQRCKKTEDITTQQKNELIEKILATVRVAVGVLQHVKEIKAIETGKMELKLEPTSIEEIFHIAQVIFEDRLMEKNITLRLEDHSAGEQFLCHKSSFSNSVFNNFISNALKFSPRGAEILVKARLENNRFLISISDQGIGIPEEIAGNLFEAGKITSRKGTDGEAGTGFGMSLAKTYMGHYNGELRFSSKTEGKTGTTFELLLQKAS